MASVWKPPDGVVSAGHSQASHQEHHGKADGDPRGTYAEKLKTNVRYDQRLKRNVLEIFFDKDDRETDIDDNCIARLFKSLGIDIGSQVEGTQVKQRVITVWMAQGINLEKFCKEDSIRVAHGVKTTFTRPAGRKDVSVTITGLDFNTPDTFIIQYLNMFGTVLDSNVIQRRTFQGKIHRREKIPGRLLQVWKIHGHLPYHRWIKS